MVGSAGTGKSHVINLTAQWTEVLLRKSGDDLDQPYCIRLCFTGAAASNISGQTLCSGLKVAYGNKFEPLNGKKREMMRTALQNVRVGKNSKSSTNLNVNFIIHFSVIIDEFSMVKSDYIYQIDSRLR